MCLLRLVLYWLVLYCLLFVFHRTQKHEQRRCLLRAGADPNAVTRAGETPLSLAGFGGSFEVRTAIGWAGGGGEDKPQPLATCISIGRLEFHFTISEELPVP